MKAKLEFNLPEEDYEFREAVNGGKYHSMLSEIDNYCRSQLKYGGPLTKEEVLENIREMIGDLEYPF